MKVESEGSGSDVEKIGSKGSKGRQTRGSQRALVNGRAKGKGKGKEREQALFLDDVDEENEGGSAPVHDLAREDLEEIDLDIDADEDEDEDGDEPVKPTRKRAAPTSRAGVASPAKGKKRTAAVLDDDSDSGVTFRGFAGRKKTRAK